MSSAKPAVENKYMRARELSGCAQNAPVAASEPAAAPGAASESAAPRRENLRLRRVDRERVVPIPARLEDLLPADHLARRIWDLAGRLDLTAFYAPIVVVEGGPGQAATDPQILATLWLYATSQGVTSARDLNELCVAHWAYIWLCGGVSMNYHTLSDFRTRLLPALDALLTQILGCLDYESVKISPGPRIQGRGRALESPWARHGVGFAALVASGMGVSRPGDCGECPLVTAQVGWRTWWFRVPRA